MTEEAVGRLRWLFAGQGEMGAAALEALLESARPVAALTAEPERGLRPCAAVAEAHGVEVRHAHALGAEPGRRWPELFAGLDVGIACCWGERLRPGALAAPAHGWFNLHPSRLPAWRGADPIAWQLLAAPREIGCSVHVMTEQQDQGPVVAEGAVPVAGNDDRGTLLHRSGARLGGLAAGVLQELAAGRPPPPRPQRDADATWCPPPGTVACADPRALTARALARVARAFSPQPGIVLATLPAHERFALIELGSARAPEDPPGTVTGLDGGRVAVACRDRWVHGRILAPDAPGTARTYLDLSPPGPPSPPAD